MLNATVTSQSRLQTPQQFREIIVKTLNNGATVKLSDVARIELGAKAMPRSAGSTSIRVPVSPS